MRRSVRSLKTRHTSLKFYSSYERTYILQAKSRLIQRSVSEPGSVSAGLLQAAHSRAPLKVWHQIARPSVATFPIGSEQCAVGQCSLYQRGVAERLQLNTAA